MKPIHPIVAQLKKKMSSAPMDSPMARTVELTKEEVGGFKKPGEAIEFSVLGTVQSVHSDGRIMVEVDEIEFDGQDDGSDETNDSSSTDSKTVRLQTEPAP